MKIIHTPSEVLRLTAGPVEKVDKKIQALIADMTSTLNRQKNPEGVGLAAPQVGVSKRIFIIKPTSEATPRAFINPEILEKTNWSEETAPAVNKKNKSKQTGRRKKKNRVQLEGCLSIPHIWGEVKRFDRVRVTWLDEQGIQQQQWFDGFEAVIIQHEADHLNGVLFTHHVLEQKQILYREENGELTEFEI